jgi:hypothetical protein
LDCKPFLNFVSFCKKSDCFLLFHCLTEDHEESKGRVTGKFTEGSKENEDWIVDYKPFLTFVSFLKSGKVCSAWAETLAARREATTKIG